MNTLPYDSFNLSQCPYANKYNCIKAIGKTEA